MRRFSAFLLTGLFVASALLSGCGSDRPIRREVAGLLKKMNKGYKHRSGEEILGFYADDFEVTDPTATILASTSERDGVHVVRAEGNLDREAWKAILDEKLGDYRDIEKAKFVLDAIETTEEGFWADVWARLYGTKQDGTRSLEESWHRMLFVDTADGLKVKRHHVKRRALSESDERHFERRAAEVGLDIRHTSLVEWEEEMKIIPGKFSGSGISAGDIDDDGDLDLLVGDGARSRLFRNDGGTFTDITAESGLGVVGKVRGAYFFDHDGDQRLDILFTRVKVGPKLFRNVDGKTFQDVTERLGDVPAVQGESAAFADLDNDGDLDVYLVEYGDFETHSWAYPIYNATDGSRSHVLRNKGDGTFERVDDPVLTPKGWGLAVAIADYDDDGDQDVYLVNDFGVNHLLRNDGDWNFTDVTDSAGVADQGYGMSAAFGDYDGDLDLDIYVANMHSSSRWVFQDPDFPLPLIADIVGAREMVQEEMAKVTRGNTLFENQGDGTFVQKAQETGTERCGWAWGANYLDYDNDGDLDIYCPNGFVTGKRQDDL